MSRTPRHGIRLSVEGEHHASRTAVGANHLLNAGRQRHRNVAVAGMTAVGNGTIVIEAGKNRRTASRMAGAPTMLRDRFPAGRQTGVVHVFGGGGRTQSAQLTVPPASAPAPRLRSRYLPTLSASGASSIQPRISAPALVNARTSSTSRPASRVATRSVNLLRERKSRRPAHWWQHHPAPERLFARLPSNSPATHFAP